MKLLKLSFFISLNRIIGTENTFFVACRYLPSIYTCVKLQSSSQGFSWSPPQNTQIKIFCLSYMHVFGSCVETVVPREKNDRCRKKMQTQSVYTQSNEQLTSVRYQGQPLRCPSNKLFWQMDWTVFICTQVLSNIEFSRWSFNSLKGDKDKSGRFTMNLSLTNYLYGILTHWVSICNKIHLFGIKMFSWNKNKIRVGSLSLQLVLTLPRAPRWPQSCTLYLSLAWW